MLPPKPQRLEEGGRGSEAVVARLLRPIMASASCPISSHTGSNPTAINLALELPPANDTSPYTLRAFIFIEISSGWKYSSEWQLRWNLRAHVDLLPLANVQNAHCPHCRRTGSRFMMTE